MNRIGGGDVEIISTENTATINFIFLQEAVKTLNWNSIQAIE